MGMVLGRISALSVGLSWLLIGSSFGDELRLTYSTEGIPGLRDAHLFYEERGTLVEFGVEGVVFGEGTAATQAISKEISSHFRLVFKLNTENAQSTPLWLNLTLNTDPEKAVPLVRALATSLDQAQPQIPDSPIKPLMENFLANAKALSEMPENNTSLAYKAMAQFGRDFLTVMADPEKQAEFMRATGKNPGALHTSLHGLIKSMHALQILILDKLIASRNDEDVYSASLSSWEIESVFFRGQWGTLNGVSQGLQSFSIRHSELEPARPMTGLALGISKMFREFIERLQIAKRSGNLGSSRSVSQATFGIALLAIGEGMKSCGQALIEEGFGAREF